MLTRKSTRISAGINVEDAESSAALQMQARKRLRTVATRGVSIQGDKKGKGRAEFYYCLPQMPFDILLTIFSELEPVDLLHLLRVSKGFHDFLWLKTTTYVWRLAYKNLENPPPCPLDVHIIHYTNFLFGIHCQFCASRTATQTEHDTGFVRLCSKCLKKHTISPRDRMVEDVRRQCHYFDGTLILELEYNLRQREMAQATKNNTLSQYFEQRQKALDYRLQHAIQLTGWRNELKRLAEQEEARINAQRRQGIQNRLRLEACVPQHISWQVYYVEFPHTRKAQELTDDEWRHIRADIIEYLFEYSENQLRSTIKIALTARLRALDNLLQQFVVTRPRIAPAILHLASSNPYSDVVTGSAALDLPVNDVLGHVAMLPKHINQWRQGTDLYLESLIPKSQRQRNWDDDEFHPLELATTFFRCDMCTEPISYPRILMHHCFLTPSGAKGGNNQQTRIQRKKKKQAVNVPRQPRAMAEVTADTVFPSMRNTFGDGMHPGRAGVSFHEEASTSARRIILACGENPDTITYTEMGQKDFRVECLLCSSTAKSRLVMRWTIAILHALDEHRTKRSPQAQWRLVDSGKDLEKVKHKETEMIKYSDILARYCCNLCDRKIKKRDQVSHLTEEHKWGGDEPNMLEQFCENIDLTMKIHPLAVRI